MLDYVRIAIMTTSFAILTVLYFCKISMLILMQNQQKHVKTATFVIKGCHSNTYDAKATTFC